MPASLVITLGPQRASRVTVDWISERTMAWRLRWNRSNRAGGLAPNQLAALGAGIKVAISAPP